MKLSILVFLSMSTGLFAQAESFELSSECYKKVSSLNQIMAEKFVTGQEKVEFVVTSKYGEGSEDGLSPLTVGGDMVVVNEENTPLNLTIATTVLVVGHGECKTLDVKIELATK